MTNRFAVPDAPARPVHPDFSRGYQDARQGREWQPGQSSEYNTGFSAGRIVDRQLEQAKEAEQST